VLSQLARMRTSAFTLRNAYRVINTYHLNYLVPMRRIPGQPGSLTM
jgi:hypothetical protein